MKPGYVQWDLYLRKCQQRETGQWQRRKQVKFQPMSGCRRAKYVWWAKNVSPDALTARIHPLESPLGECPQARERNWRDQQDTVCKIWPYATTKSLSLTLGTALHSLGQIHPMIKTTSTRGIIEDKKKWLNILSVEQWTYLLQACRLLELGKLTMCKSSYMHFSGVRACSFHVTTKGYHLSRRGISKL